ncbi:MAG: hypothetical protein NC483_02260 [Ruminococcus sp.]|nr:hypothetical protein [Ruminococcus sp.]
MKIEVERRGTKNYYDEFLYVVSHTKKLKINPHKKVRKLTTSLKYYGLFVLLCIILFIIFYLYSYDVIFIFLSGMLSLLLIYTIFYFSFVTKRIKLFQKQNDKKIISINEYGIEYIDDSKNIRINWEEIAIIIINKYSICFLPKDTANAFISISVDYKDLVIKGINKYKRESLITDNGNLYR